MNIKVNYLRFLFLTTILNLNEKIKVLFFLISLFILEQSVKTVREEEGWRRKPNNVEPKEQLDNIARRKLAYDHHDEEELDSNYLGVAVGALVSVIFILISIILFILYKNYTVSRDEDEIDLEPEGSWSKVYRTYRDKSLRYSPPTSEGNNTGSHFRYNTS